MSGVRETPRAGLYQGWYRDAVGRRRWFTGTRSKAETLRIAQRLEDEHRQVRLGYRPVPTAARRYRVRPIIETIDEYLAWGTAQGGRGGRGWSPVHAHNRSVQLTWWREALGLATLADLDGVLPRAEKALRERQRETQRTGRTLAAYAEALCALCDWCVQRGYLEIDPLRGLASFDTTPQTRRRALTPDETVRLLSCAPPERRVLYEVALFSGLRVNELRHLTGDHLDAEGSGLRLEGAWTKNRKEGFQPLPASLVARLQAEAVCGRPLLQVPSHPARDLDVDLLAAGIPKRDARGKVDFHALRATFVSLVVEAGASVREAQELARHASPFLTFGVYAQSRSERLAATVERVAAQLTDRAGGAGVVAEPGIEWSVARATG